MGEPSIYAVNHLGSLGDALKGTVARVAQAAGGNSVTGWQPAHIPPAQQQVQQGPAPDPVREPWMSDGDWERYQRHIRQAAHEAEECSGRGQP